MAAPRPGKRWHARALAVVVAVLAGGGVAVAAVVQQVVGPQSGIQPNGRKLDPAGKLTELGNHPYGGALTRDGRYLWTLSAGFGINDIRIVRVRPTIRCGEGTSDDCRRRRRDQVGEVVQRIPMPGLSGGIATDPSRNRVYVAGLAESDWEDEQPPKGVPGRQGDVIHVFKYRSKSGRARRAGVIPVPPPPGTLPYQTFPPTPSTQSWPQELAISANGKTLLAALNLADAAAVIDTAHRSVRYVRVGHYPYGAAITANGEGLVTSETQGTVSEINLARARKVGSIQVGPRLSHPEGIAIDPTQPRAYVAVTAQDLIAVIDTHSGRVERTLSVARPQGNGTAPIRVSVTPDGCYLLSADSGEDALAVFALPQADGRTCAGDRGKRPRPWKLIGRVPTAAYPVGASVTPGGRKLVWIAAKGLGVGSNPNGPDPNSPNDNANSDSSHIIETFDYLPAIVRGESGILRFPTRQRLRRLTPRADREIVPTNSQLPPAGTPVSPNGPIEHVFFVVRENRTYDQVLGDDPRGDGDPNLTLFGKRVTPNLHALARRFPLLDRVYANSEASIDGHHWTAAASVSDYVVRNWPQNTPNYGARDRPYDFGGAYEVSDPPRGFLFWRALREHVSFFNYGEVLGLSPLPDKDRTVADLARNARALAHSDIAALAGVPAPVPNACYDSDLSNSTVLGQGLTDVYDSSLPAGAQPGSHSRFDCFRARFKLQLATNSVPAFNYVVVPNDHTEGTLADRRTPTAQIASNDWALGQIVDLVSHSPIWKRSLILVVEDDSQDGADHVDAHRIPALAISPYTRRGAVIHTRYDLLSFIKTMEIIVGLPRLNLAEALAVPLYDAFTSQPLNDAPYDAITPRVDMTARNTEASPASRLSAALPLGSPDQVPQRILDRILWKYIHGRHAKPPPPGPNASADDEGAAESVRLPRVKPGQRANVRALQTQYRRHSRNR